MHRASRLLSARCRLSSAGLAWHVRPDPSRHTVTSVVFVASILKLLGNAGAAECRGQHSAWRGIRCQGHCIWDVLARRRGAAQSAIPHTMASAALHRLPTVRTTSHSSMACLSASTATGAHSEYYAHALEGDSSPTDRAGAAREPRLPRPACTRRIRRAASPKPPPRAPTARPKTWSLTWCVPSAPAIPREACTATMQPSSREL